MSKKLLYASATREGGTLHAELLAGVEEIALAVGSTLGPRGLNTIIDRAGDTPLVTKDGVTVARNIQLTDPVRNAAAKMIQAVGVGTVNEAGDGTTTATVLAYNILKKGLAMVEAGASPVDLQRAILFATEVVVSRITELAAVPTDEQIAQVATIATNGNVQFGSLVLEAISKVGREGHITFDDSNDATTKLEVREGFHLPSGFLWPDFVTDRQRGTCVLENPLILITERQLSQGVAERPTLHDLGPLLTYCLGRPQVQGEQAREKRDLLILCDDVLPGSDAAQTLLINHAKGILKICVVRAPGFGELKRALLQDAAIVTGGRVLTLDGGNILARWVFDSKGATTARNLGTCKRAIISNGRCILEDCGGDPQDPELVSKYATSLREQTVMVTDPQQREYLLQRAARLNGQVAVIRVGANTDTEARSLRDLAEDAVLSVRAALAEGIVAGGGLCLFLLAHQLAATAEDMPERVRAGAELLAVAMKAPLRLIAANAGFDPDYVEGVVGNAAKVTKDRWPEGFNAATGQYQDLVAAGIVDPAKVVRTSLQKASSIAALMLTSSCMVYLDPDAQRGQPVIQLPPIPQPMQPGR